MAKVGDTARDLRMFENIARQADDRMVFGGTREGDSIRSVRDNALGRAAVWVRRRLGTGHRQSVDHAYTRFSNAIQFTHPRAARRNWRTLTRSWRPTGVPAGR